jgi:hypothetical protein
MVMQVAEAIKQTVDQTASTLADLMLGVRRDWGKAFADILRDFGRMIIQMLVKALLLKALKSIFGGPFGGLLGEGGIVGAPGVPNLQAGGTVVRRETVFVAGERGPEAVIPLHKLPELVSEIEKRRGRRAANITLNINPTQLDRLFELAPASVRSRIYESTLPGSRYEDSRR